MTRTKQQHYYTINNIKYKFTIKAVYFNAYSNEEIVLHDGGLLDKTLLDKTLQDSWCLYIHLYPGCYLFEHEVSTPDEGSSFPDLVDWDWWSNPCTYYNAHYDKFGNMTEQIIGFDYQHSWDEDYGDAKKARVLADQMKLYKNLLEVCGGEND